LVYSVTVPGSRVIASHRQGSQLITEPMSKKTSCAWRFGASEGGANMYLYAREGLDQIPTTLQPRNLTLGDGYAFGAVPSAVEGFGQPVDPGILRTPPKMNPGIVQKTPGTADPVDIDPGIVQKTPGTVDPVDVANYLLTQAEIKRQLERNFRAGDVAGFLDRRRKLRQAFESVPRSFAQHLLGRLVNKHHPLAKLFNYKIATSTRNELIAILLKKSSETI